MFLLQLPCGLSCRATILGLLVILLLGPVTVDSAEAQISSSPPDAFTEAYELYQDNLYGAAANAFRALRRDNPRHVKAAEALYYEASSQLALGRIEDAVRLFRVLQQRYPAHPLAQEARLALGQYFYEQGDFEQAISTLSDVVDDRPPAEVAAQSLYWMGSAANELGRTDEAIMHWRRAANEYRRTSAAPMALYAIAFVNVEAERYDEAARELERLSERYPDTPYARDVGLALAEAYYELGDYERAVQEIRQRMGQLDDQARDRANFLLAESYNQLRDSQNAIRYYRRFTEGNPNSPFYRRAVYGLAWNYHFEGIHQWAAERFEIVADGHDDELAEQASYYRGINLKLSRNLQGAVSAFEQTAERWPDGLKTAEALFELGMTQYELREWDAAEEAFSRLINNHDDSELLGEALQMRGYANIARGASDQAFDDFDRAVALDAAPEELRDEIRFQRAWLQYRTGDYSSAYESFSELVSEGIDGPRAGETLFWQAESRYQLGVYHEAAQLFERYLREHPGGTYVEAAHYALGWSLFQQQRYAESVNAFNQFLRAYRDDGGAVPYRTDAVLRLADSYFAQRQFQDAITTYRRVLDEGGDYALYQIGQAYYHSGQPQQAIDSFEQLRSRYPDSRFRAQALYSIAFTKFENQQYEEAIEAYQQLIDERPGTNIQAEAQYAIGDAHFNAGDLDEAMQAYEAVLDRYPESGVVGDAAAGIMFALAARGEIDRADEVINRFAERNPDSPIVDQMRFRKAEVLYQDGRLDRSLNELQQFIRTSENVDLLPDAYYLVGTIYQDRDRPDEAVVYFRQIVDAYPMSGQRADAARRLGSLYMEIGRYESALEAYETLEGASQNNQRLLAESRYGQGRALLRLGQIDEARELLTSAVDEAPDEATAAPALLGLGRVDEAQGRDREAREKYQRAADLRQDETGAEALYRAGAIELSLGNLERAVELFSSVSARFGSYPEWVAQSYLGQARAFRQLNRPGDARRMYERVTNEFGDTPFAETAEQELARL